MAGEDARGLRNVIGRIVVLDNEEEILPENLRLKIRSPVPAASRPAAPAGEFVLFGLE